MSDEASIDPGQLTGPITPLLSKDIDRHTSSRSLRDYWRPSLAARSSLQGIAQPRFVHSGLRRSDGFEPSCPPLDLSDGLEQF